ncbi:N-acetylmuramoyl-L-alanine amidase [Streptomyces sp. NBC_00247]|uniref:peptidoglycan recognition protein family protein n=1 Tax=Streptomyces sp. NBC_00247 TaxID=2975689 RepID=UPI002E2E83BE|nr:N-acetylmuramoyl-L-alanine amidase [Streptomyces sp. NBC_00247]
MRTLHAATIGVTCAAALTLSLAAPTPALPVARASATPAADPPGSTQSLPLAPLAENRAAGETAATAAQGLTPREVEPFSLLGVVWDDAATELPGTVEVRTRATATARWSGWQAVETHNDEHAAEPGTPEGDAASVRGATAPLWVGASDAVEVRVRPTITDLFGRAAEPAVLPKGLRLELVDPGADPPATASTVPGAQPAAGTTATDGTGGTGTGTTVPPDTDTADVAVLPALSRAQTIADAQARGLGLPAAPEADQGADAPRAGSAVAAAKPYIGPRPGIITRKGWGADEKLRESQFAYTTTVKAAFVHHSATGNNYTCSQSASILRGIYRYHVKSNGWRDIGYNFAVDKCGNIYEGRAGGVTRAVLGAHTLGFNSKTMGIAVLGSYASTNPPTAAVNAVAKLTAWKLGLFGINPKGTVTLVSGGGNRYKKGSSVKMNAISGHRDGFATECPGARLYKKLGTTRTTSARLQGR